MKIDSGIRFKRNGFESDVRDVEWGEAEEYIMICKL